MGVQYCFHCVHTATTLARIKHCVRVLSYVLTDIYCGIHTTLVDFSNYTVVLATFPRKS